MHSNVTRITLNLYMYDNNFIQRVKLTYIMVYTSSIYGLLYNFNYKSPVLGR